MSFIRPNLAQAFQPELALTIRELKAPDALQYRELRLEALKAEAHYFTASQELDPSRTDSMWAADCAPTHNNRKWGAFLGDKLVGSVSAFPWDRDANKLICANNGELESPWYLEPDEKIIRWGHAYVRSNYRQMGLFEQLIRMREQWSQSEGYTSAVFTIREDNARSRSIHTENQATPFGQQPMIFADGSNANAIWYRKQLLHKTARLG